MKRFEWMAGAKALAATTALVCAAMVASSSAKADQSYTFSYNSTSSNSMTAIGAFTLSGTNITSVSGSFADSSGSQGPVAYSISSTYNGSTLSPAGGSNYSIFAFFGDGGSLFNAQYVGILTNSNGNLSGNITVNDFVTANKSTGLFTAFAAAVTPGSGGGSGGGGGSAGGGSGGAPIPEVNAGLGVLLAGASFVFLRRKRGGRREMAAA